MDGHETEEGTWDSVFPGITVRTVIPVATFHYSLFTLHYSSVPPAVQVPFSLGRVAVDPEEFAIVTDTAEILSRFRTLLFVTA
jgi:hypothetical protein